MKKRILTAILFATFVQATFAENTPQELDIIATFKYDRFSTPYGTFNAYAEKPLNSREYLKQINFEQTLAKAKSGDATAQFQIGKMYQLGIQVPKNSQQAFDWYSQSAKQGNANAQANLAVLYMDGDGVQQNSQKAIELWTQASQTVPTAKFNLAVYQLNQNRNDKAAFATLEQLAHDNFIPALYALGLYFYQNGSPQDKSKGFELIKQAAGSGLADAQFHLAQFYMGKLNTPDENQRIQYAEEAQYWVKRSCRNEHPMACDWQGHLKELPSILEQIKRDLDKAKP